MELIRNPIEDFIRDLRKQIDRIVEPALEAQQAMKDFGMEIPPATYSAPRLNTRGTACLQHLIMERLGAFFPSGSSNEFKNASMAAALAVQEFYQSIREDEMVDPFPRVKGGIQSEVINLEEHKQSKSEWIADTYQKIIAGCPILAEADSDAMSSIPFTINPEGLNRILIQAHNAAEILEKSGHAPWSNNV